MDVQDWLRTVVSDCSLLTQPAEAIALAPDIAVDGPGLVGVRPEGAKDPWFGFPTAFSERLSGPLVELIGERLVALKRGEQEELSELAPSRLGDDALFGVLTQLLLETSGFGPRPASLVALELARQSAAIVSGDVASVGTTAAGRQTQAVSEGRAWYASLEGRERGAAIARLVWSLTGRMSAAWTVCEEIDPRIRPTRFYQSLVKNKLVFGLPSGALGSSADLDVVAGVLGIDVQRSMLDAAHRALTAAVAVALGGKPGAIAGAIRDLAGLGASAEVAVFDPRITALAVAGLSELVDTKALQAAGVPKQEAKALLKGEGARPLIAAWTQAATALRTWDLLAAAAGRCLPLRRRGQGAHTRLGMLEPSALFSLLVPRGSAVASTSVVAVQLAGAWRDVAGRVDKAPGVAASMRGLIERLRREAAVQGGLSQVQGSVGLFAFDGAGTASAFQDRARDVLGTTLRLGRGALGDDVLLSDDGLYDIDVATGEVFGGFAAGELCIWGPAVDRAVGGLTVAAADDAPEENSVDWSGAAPAASLSSPEPEEEDAFGDAFASAEYSDVDWDAEPEPEPEPAPAGFASSESDEEGLAFGYEPAPAAEPEAEVDFEDDDDDAFEFEVDEEEQAHGVQEDPEPEWDDEPVADDPSSVDWGAAAVADDLEPPSEEPESQEGHAETFFLPPPDLADLPPEEADDSPLDEPEYLEEPESQPSDADDDDDDGLGFSLGPTLDDEADASPPPPAADDEDDGFFDPDSEDLVEMDSSIAWLTSKVKPTESEAEPAPEPETTSASAPGGSALPDLEYLFQGYVTFDDPDGGVVFGRRYGGRLFDVHAYGDGDRGQAYLAFLNDKVREGFVPRSDLTRQIPTGVQVADLDLEEMGRAYRAIS